MTVQSGRGPEKGKPISIHRPTAEHSSSPHVKPLVRQPGSGDPMQPVKLPEDFRLCVYNLF